MQPTQQQGRRMPDPSFDNAFLILISLVSAFLPDMTQHIHSLRASGVTSPHTANALGEEIMAFRKSAGIPCTTPAATSFLLIRL
jgi:hypothetical protein